MFLHFHYSNNINDHPLMQPWLDTLVGHIIDFHNPFSTIKVQLIKISTRYYMVYSVWNSQRKNRTGKKNQENAYIFSKYILILTRHLERFSTTKMQEIIFEERAKCQHKVTFLGPRVVQHRFQHSNERLLHLTFQQQRRSRWVYAWFVHFSRKTILSSWSSRWLEEENSGLN